MENYINDLTNALKDIINQPQFFALWFVQNAVDAEQWPVSVVKSYVIDAIDYGYDYPAFTLAWYEQTEGREAEYLLVPLSDLECIRKAA